MPLRRRAALVCELHAHTRWSDGSLSLSELVDLYGTAGFDVLCITDHVVAHDTEHVHAGNHAAYLAAIDAEAVRARERHGLLVLPGLELTDDHDDPDASAHVVAVGLRSFVGLERGLDAAVLAARAAGAALIAAHPYTPGSGAATRATTRFARDRTWAAEAVDRFELFNRHELFGWVADARLPAVASGDAHEPEHLHTWKTALPCEQHPEAVVDYLRSRRPALLVPAPAGERAAVMRARAS